jgi:hypothetical protein
MEAFEGFRAATPATNGFEKSELESVQEKASPKREEPPVADNKKCAHPNCSCTVTEGRKYCSPQCEAMEKTPDVDCKCGHPGCKGRAT